MDLILASHNRHKFDEISAAFEGTFINLIQAPSPVEVEENANSYRGNARLKALAYAEKFSCNVLADDSGLSVAALDGAPGLRSARYSQSKAADPTADNNALLLRALEGVTDRRAFFVCSLCLYIIDDKYKTQMIRNPSAEFSYEGGGLCFYFDGFSHGKILEKPGGINGFGYDPLFFSDDLSKTFAEASPEEKMSVSHRGRAIRKMLDII